VGDRGGRYCPFGIKMLVLCAVYFLAGSCWQTGRHHEVKVFSCLVRCLCGTR
jgi:hypothetical protein